MEPLLFWSTAPTEIGRKLSNFYPCPVQDGEIKDLIHKSSEHAYFYHLCATEAGKKMILAAPDARAAKAASKQTMQNDWKGRHKNVMIKVLRWKFSTPNRIKALLMTGSRQLLHYAPWGDTYWGVDRSLEGQNLQGILLMQVRGEVTLLQA